MNAKEFHQFTKALRSNQQQQVRDCWIARSHKAFSQPTPVSTNSLNFADANHGDHQWQRIGAKSDEDIATLDNIRDYMRRRAEIEQDYQAKLERLSKSFASKRRVLSALVPRSASGSLSSGSASEGGGAEVQSKDGAKEGVRLPQHAFSIFLSESEKQAQFRGRLADKLNSEIVDVIKEYNKERTIVSKKQLEYGASNRTHKELYRFGAGIVGQEKMMIRMISNILKSDINPIKVKLKYEQASKDADAAQAKYDLESNRGTTAFTALRNMVKRVKIGVHEDSYIKFRQLKQKLKAAYRSLQITDITVDEFSKIVLSQKLGQYHQRNQEVLVQLQRVEKAIAGLSQMVNAYSKTPEFGNANSASDEKADLEYQLHVLTNEKLRLETLMNLLIEKKVELPKLVTPVAQSKSIGSSSAIALFDYASKIEGELSIHENDRLILLEGEKDGWVKAQKGSQVGLVPANYVKVDVHTNATGSDSASTTFSELGANCVKAVYDHVASDDTELSFVAGDIIEVTEKPNEGDQNLQWWEGKHLRTGQVGQFPIIFTQGWDTMVPPAMARHTRSASIVSTNSITPKKATVRAKFDYTATCDGELSMKAGDIIVVTSKATGSDAWWEGKEEVQESPGTLRRAIEPLTPKPSTFTQRKVKALYDYEAADPDELSFKENDIISVTSANDTDDWWEGKLGSKKGVFPKTYVQKV
ncbi:hypothetical protein HDU93_003079 [Gonapodya sp. JEL0774]|nr:hypothetical protein HDU93_003079 [Gonapodya sp. JEL0774]